MSNPKSYIRININPRNGNTTKDILNSVFTTYQDYISESQKQKIIDEISNFLMIKMKCNSSTNEELLEKVQIQRKYYYFDFIIHKIFKQILNQDFLTSKLNERMRKIDHFGRLFIYDTFDFCSIYSYFQIICDKSMKFYLQKIYAKELPDAIKDREIKLMTKNLSKFLVTILDINKDYKILIPYFPMGTYYSIMLHNRFCPEKTQVDLSIVDKIVIILEIATTLNDLHIYGQYHGNLSTVNIFLTASKDAYIGSFCYDNEFKLDSGLYESFCIQPPGKHNLGSEVKSEVNFEEGKSGDIYSLGILMHEILTEIDVLKRFKIKRMSRHMIVNLLDSRNFYEFLINDDFNEIFEDESMDEIKMIIQKCMKYDVDERYFSVSEVIHSIKSTKIYIENKEEIEFRIQNAVDASDYECTLADIVECYLHGKFDSQFVVDKLLISYLRMYDDNIEKIESENDIIKTIFNTFK